MTTTLQLDTMTATAHENITSALHTVTAAMTDAPPHPPRAFQDSLCVSGALWPDYDGVYTAQASIVNSFIWYKNSNDKSIYMRASQDRWYFDDDRSADNGVWGFLSSAIGETPVESRVSGVPSMWLGQQWIDNPEMQIMAYDCEQIQRFSPNLSSRLTVLIGAVMLAFVILLTFLLITRLLGWWVRRKYQMKEHAAQKAIENEIDRDGSPFDISLSPAQYSSSYARSLSRPHPSIKRRPSLPAIPNPFGHSNRVLEVDSPTSSQSSLGMIGEEISDDDSDLNWNLETLSDEDDDGSDRYGRRNRSLSVSFIYDMGMDIDRDSQSRRSST